VNPYACESRRDDVTAPDRRARTPGSAVSKS
jgi:hypothetical protein